MYQKKKHLLFEGGENIFLSFFWGRKTNIIPLKIPLDSRWQHWSPLFFGVSAQCRKAGLSWQFLPICGWEQVDMCQWEKTLPLIMEVGEELPGKMMNLVSKMVIFYFHDWFFRKSTHIRMEKRAKMIYIVWRRLYLITLFQNASLCFKDPLLQKKVLMDAQRWTYARISFESTPHPGCQSPPGLSHF